MSARPWLRTSRGTVLGGFSGRMWRPWWRRIRRGDGPLSSWRCWICCARWHVGVAAGRTNISPSLPVSACPPRGPCCATCAIRGWRPHMRWASAYCSPLVATFTYVNFYLAAPPFGLSTAALGLLFVVYLVGAVVTPLPAAPSTAWATGSPSRWPSAGGVAGIALTLVRRLPVVLVGLGAVLHGRVHRPIGGIELTWQRRRRSRAPPPWALRDVLLPGRQRRECDPGIFLDAWRVAGVRRTDCRGAVGDDLAGADFLAAAGEGGGSSVLTAAIEEG